ncbi:protein IroB [Spongiactinospora rosea]|uniref:Protein IroB n=1 Tax=Spongiactinospora rosea TaxID=2248750 RepID=A0A366M3N8_9ACTN|nr:nucleotide disphospho-sugar-binding domain-containing protein [Spongiactinospora rosea]RBQ20801.1 protein IroB [Spongiactinospora rosea]
MRVLFTSWAWPSHLYAMVPLAWAMRAAGHEVLVAGQPSLAVAAAHAGLPYAPIGSDVDSVGMVRGYALPTRRFGTPPALPSNGRGPRALRMFQVNAEAMVDDLVELAREWRPRLVVHDPTAWAGSIAAAAIGVPAVRHLYGADLMHAARPFLAGLLAPMGERHGLEDLDPLGAATIDPYPADVQVDVDYEPVPLKYVPYNGPGITPRLRPAARPRVCVTWGTTIARVDPERFLAGDVVRALASPEVEVVAAVTAAQREWLGPVPEGVRIVQDAPLHAVLPGCDLLVAHGGAGTSLTGMAAGLPQLLVPQLPDHEAHATRLARTGAAVLLPVDQAGPAELRERALGLLHDARAGAAAARLREEIAARPAPADVVPLLEEVAAAFSARPPGLH